MSLPAASVTAEGTSTFEFVSSDRAGYFGPASLYISAANADHLIAVSYVNGQWLYDNNSSLTSFSPQPDYCLVADLDFTNDTASAISSPGDPIHNIDSGFASGNLAVRLTNGTAPTTLVSLAFPDNLSRNNPNDPILS